MKTILVGLAILFAPVARGESLEKTQADYAALKAKVREFKAAHRAELRKLKKADLQKQLEKYSDVK